MTVSQADLTALRLEFKEEVKGLYKKHEEGMEKLTARCETLTKDNFDLQLEMQGRLDSVDTAGALMNQTLGDIADGLSDQPDRMSKKQAAAAVAGGGGSAYVIFEIIKQLIEKFGGG